MIGQSKMYRLYKAAAGVTLVGLMLLAPSYEIEHAAPCLCQLVFKAAGMTSQGLHLVCLLSGVQAAGSAGIWEYLKILSMLTEVAASIWPVLNALAG
jgi:hypothetical protein